MSIFTQKTNQYPQLFGEIAIEKYLSKYTQLQLNWHLFKNGNCAGYKRPKYFELNIFPKSTPLKDCL